MYNTSQWSTHVEFCCRISKLRIIWNVSHESSFPTSSWSTLKGDVRDVVSRCDWGKLNDRSKAMSVYVARDTARGGLHKYVWYVWNNLCSRYGPRSGVRLHIRATGQRWWIWLACSRCPSDLVLVMWLKLAGGTLRSVAIARMFLVWQPGLAAQIPSSLNYSYWGTDLWCCIDRVCTYRTGFDNPCNYDMLGWIKEQYAWLFCS